MEHVVLRPATSDEAGFALQVTEQCMKVYAEQSWGAWDGRADFDPENDKILQRFGVDIGLMGVEPHPDHWFLEKLYLLPAYQNQGIGTYLLKRLLNEAKSAQVALRLSVLNSNLAARRLYERHGFVLTQTISPRHHMECYYGAVPRQSTRNWDDQNR